MSEGRISRAVRPGGIPARAFRLRAASVSRVEIPWCEDGHFDLRKWTIGLARMDDDSCVNGHANPRGSSLAYEIGRRQALRDAGTEARGRGDRYAPKP